jgi:hypothetical protein
MKCDKCQTEHKTLSLVKDKSGLFWLCSKCLEKAGKKQ